MSNELKTSASLITHYSSLITSSSDRPALAPADEEFVLLRLRVAFDDERRDRLVRRFRWQALEAHAIVVLLEDDGLARGEKFRRRNFIPQAREGQLVARPEVYVKVERVAAAREAAVARAARLAYVGEVDRLAVLVHPLTDGVEYGDRLRGDGAVGLGADVEKVVAAVVRARDEVADDLLRRLPGVVGALVTPTVVHRHARLPRAPRLGGLDALFGRGEVARELVAVVDDDVGLKLEDHLVHALRLPALRVQGPGHVVPEHVNLAIVGHQLAQVRVDVLDEAAARGLVRGAARAVR